MKGIILWEVPTRRLPFMEYHDHPGFVREIGGQIHLRQQVLIQAIVSEGIRPTFPRIYPFFVFLFKKISFLIVIIMIEMDFPKFSKWVELTEECWDVDPSCRPLCSEIIPRIRYKLLTISSILLALFTFDISSVPIAHNYTGELCHRRIRSFSIVSPHL
jgi:hypothetical protein